MIIEKPMLATSAGECDADFAKLKFPLLASPKLDGIRCINAEGKVLSRSFKDIPNKHIRQTLSNIFKAFPNMEFDGELMVGDSFNGSSSGIMSQDGEPDFIYNVFDLVTASPLPFNRRYEALMIICEQLSEAIPNCPVRLVEHTLVNNIDELSAFEADCLAKGFEGAMVRDPNGKYKYGRSSVKEGILLKIKRFARIECKIIGFDEKFHNDNEKTEDAFGRGKRSSHQENMIPLDTLGSLVLLTPEGLEFRCGTGFSEEQRKEIWENKEKYLAKLACINYQPSGTVDLPRFPSYVGIRSPDDLS